VRSENGRKAAQLEALQREATLASILGTKGEMTQQLAPLKTV